MTATHSAPKPIVGIVGLTGCAGDQLVVLNCERELLDLAQLVDLREFPMASSNGAEGVALDIAFVEGAVVSQRDEDVLHGVRERARTLVALGTCAAWGGVAALDRLFDRDQLVRDVYGDAGAAFDTRPARSVRDVVAVEYVIPGCPIERDELLQAIAHLLQGNPPLPRDVPVCAECRMRESNCLLMERGVICCGPVTVGGCNARCPAVGTPCIGCRGPSPDANLPAALAAFAEQGIIQDEARRRLELFAAIPISRTEEPA
ncbi:MAG: NADH:ubiquinone oxidoreductase [Gemmatimonadota bacterium]|nr:NADH:ubiquinone oxidoreductase [Gemmatimonadota bacterium]MDH5197335.1 NADH:ubiquinone oxidoreductase [Gemmatimonadota bacterium]